MNQQSLYTCIFLYIHTPSGVKNVLLSKHAMIRAKQRNIAYPDQIFIILQTGKQTCFGKRYVRFENNSIICIGEMVNEVIIIKTVERK